MKCFVASAFGHDDVDAIYDNCIKPVLKQLSITPLRVDRIEHNEDIDNKIFELLDSSDFVIADLTYARPSVYYEAGYATGKSKPVVYITRNDHFKAQDSDPQGLLRVHFDIQMKNIISWDSPNNEFSSKLLSRLRHILKPLIRMEVEEKKVSSERTEFDRLSLDAKLSLLRKKAILLLNAQSFKRYPHYLDISYRFSRTVFFAHVHREHAQKWQRVSVLTTSSAPSSLFDYINTTGDYIIPKDYSEMDCEIHYIIATLMSVPRSRITSALSSFQPLSNSTYHRKSATKRPSSGSINIFIHVNDKTKSSTEFAEFSKSILQQYNLDRY